VEVTDEMIEVALGVFEKHDGWCSTLAVDRIPAMRAVLEAVVPIPSIRVFTSLGDPFWIKGRGPALNIIQPDPKIEVGEIIRMNGNIERVVGVASYKSIGGDAPGRPVSVLVEVQPWRAKLHAFEEAFRSQIEEGEEL
jgi:hypothetical protein